MWNERTPELPAVTGSAVAANVSAVVAAVQTLAGVVAVPGVSVTV